MNGSILLMLAVIFVAGLIGGTVNALISDNGFVLPKPETDGAGQGTQVLRPGFLGNMFIGGMGAIVSWCLYTAASGVLIGRGAATPPDLTLGSLAGAVLIGIGGARWLTNEVDKTMLREAAVHIAGKQPSVEASNQLALATPAEALKIARSL